MKEIKDLSAYKVDASEVLLQGVNENSNNTATSQLKAIFEGMLENTVFCHVLIHGIIERTTKTSDQHLNWLFRMQDKIDKTLSEKRRIGKYVKNVNDWPTWCKEVETAYEGMDNDFKQKYPKPTNDKTSLFVLGSVSNPVEGLKLKGITKFDNNLLLPLNVSMFSNIDGQLTPKFEIGQSFEVLVKGKETKYLQINPSPVVVSKLVEVEA